MSREPTQGQIDARIRAAQHGARSLFAQAAPAPARGQGVALTAPEWKEIDHWAAARGIGNRLEAIRQLVALGLQASSGEEKPKAE